MANSNTGKSAASAVQRDKEALDHIYNDPATEYALALFERFRGQALDEAGFKDYLDSLPADAGTERAKLQDLLSGTNTNIEADLNTRSGQLVWAAGLAHAFQASPPGTIRSHPVWKTLTDNRQVAGSLGATARFIDMSATNRNATMDWGAPGSWFWFAPDKNHVNIDLFHTLLTGFGEDPAPSVKGMAHASGVMMHEVGHSQLTTRFTDKMQALQKRETELMEASEERKLTQDEFKELARVRTEFSLRMNVMNAAEDNCVNQYAANHGQDFPHDFGASLNVVNVLLQGTGHYLRSQQDQSREQSKLQEILENLMSGSKQKEVQEAGQALANLNKAIALSFYATNGLFDKSDMETWKRLGIDPDKIKTADANPSPSAVGHFLGTGSRDFDHLLDLNVGPHGMASLQPQSRDRWLLRSVFARSIETYADRRCRIIDEIWDKYAAHHAKVLIEAAENNAQERMDQKKNGRKNNGNQPKSSSQQGQGSGESSQQNTGEGSSQQSSPDDPSPSGQSQPGGEQKGGNNGSVDVEGVGEMDVDDNPLPSTPEEARKADRKGGEEDISPDKAQTVRDLAKEAKKQERENANDESGSANDKSNNAGNQKPGEDKTSSGSNTQGGRQRGVDLAALAQGDWREFRKRINELEPVIARVSHDFTYIRDRQKQVKYDISRQREKLPRGGDIRERLDMRSHMNFAVKRATGQRIEEPDLRRWRKDQVTMEPTSVELWVLTDGSDSMTWTNRGRPIDPAVQSMAILYEAGRRADFEVFAGMWGDDRIRMLAEPGWSERKIGDNFERVRNGIDSGTQLSPSFGQAVARSAKQETTAQGKPKQFAGMTHFLILSDGELNGGDIDPLVKMITKLFKHGPSVSVDIAVLGQGTGAEMNSVVSQVKRANPAAAIDVIKASSAREIPVLLAQKIKQRFERSTQDLQAVPDAAKREAFGRAHRAIKQANPG